MVRLLGWVRSWSREIGNILDQVFDKDVERCKLHPFATGPISTTEAVWAFLLWVPVTLAITHATLRETVFLYHIPVWTLNLVYPLVKRLFPFPCVVIGAMIGGAVFPGSTGPTHSTTSTIPTITTPVYPYSLQKPHKAAWVVYFDILYATQDPSTSRS
ncbi:unnamed protein product [Penicillium glandicola]